MRFLNRYILKTNLAYIISTNIELVLNTQIYFLQLIDLNISFLIAQKRLEIYHIEKNHQPLYSINYKILENERTDCKFNY